MIHAPLSLIRPALLVAFVTSMGCGAASPDLPTCADYCDTIMSSCTTVPQYPNIAACNANCEDWADLSLGTFEDEGGADQNTVGCRLYHAEVASQTNPDLHCPHAGPSGGDVCGDVCLVFCELAAKNCSSLYADEATCLTACNQFPVTGAPNDETGDSVWCRISHMGLAGSEPPQTTTAFCPAGQPDGGGICI